MTPSSTETPDAQRKPKQNALAVWLVLVTVIFVTLACCGQLALLLDHEDYPSADTRSRLSASYLAWPYSEIPPIDFAALLEDLQKDQEKYGTPGQPPIVVVEEDEIVVIPTSTTGPIAEISPTPTARRQTPTVFARTGTLTATPSPTFTRRPTSSPTRPPAATPSPSATNTFPPPPPTPTNTEEPPPPTSTHTQTPRPTSTNTQAPPPSGTPSHTPVTPSPTPITPTPTDTDTPEAPTPTYAPVRPIAENNGESEIDPLGRGCLAYFGYRNDNPTVVTIPLGERNYFSQPYVFIDPDPPPSVLQIERVSPAFMVIWNTGEPFIWYLDGRQAAEGLGR